MVSRFDEKNCPKGEHFVDYGADGGYCRKNPKSKAKRSHAKSRRRPKLKVKQRSLNLKSGGEDRDGGFGRGVTVGLAGLGASGLALGGAYLAGKALHGENIRKREQEERESRRPAPEQEEWSENRRRHEMKQRQTTTEEKVDPDKAEAKKKTVDPDRAEAPPKQQMEKKVGEGDAPPPPKHHQPAVQPPPKKEPDSAVLVKPNEVGRKAIARQEEKQDSTRVDRKCPTGQHFVDYKKGYCRKSPKSSNRRPPKLRTGNDDYSRGRSQANAEAVKVGVGIGAVGLAAAGIAGGYAFAQHATKQAEDESNEREKRYRREREEEEAWKQERKRRAEAEADREAGAEAEARRGQQNRTGEEGATAPPKGEEEQTTAKALPKNDPATGQKALPPGAIIPPPGAIITPPPKRKLVTPPPTDWGGDRTLVTPPIDSDVDQYVKKMGLDLEPEKYEDDAALLEIVKKAKKSGASDEQITDFITKNHLQYAAYHRRKTVPDSRKPNATRKRRNYDQSNLSRRYTRGDSLTSQIRADKKNCPPKHHFVNYGRDGYCRKNPGSNAKQSRTKSRRRSKSSLRAPGGKLKSGQDQLSLRGPLVIAGTGLLATAVGVGALAYTGRRGQVARDPLESPYSPPKVEREFSGKGHKDETEDPEMAERLKNLEKTVEEMSKQPQGGTQVEVNTTVNPPNSGGGGQQATATPPPTQSQQQAQQQATATPPPDGKTTVYPPNSPNEHDSAAIRAEEEKRQRQAAYNARANEEQEKKRKKWASDKNPEAKEMSDELKARANKKKQKREEQFRKEYDVNKNDETIAINSTIPLDSTYNDAGKLTRTGIEPHPDFPREIYSDKEIDARAKEILSEFEHNKFPKGDFRMMSNPMILKYKSGTDANQSHQPMDDHSHFQYYALKRAQALNPETFNSTIRQNGGTINAYVVNPEQETNYADISKAVKKFDEVQKFKSRNEQQISHYAPVDPAAKMEPPVGQQARRNVVSGKSYTSGDTTTKIDVDVDNYLAFASSSNKNFEDAKIHVGGMLYAQQQKGDTAARAMKLDDIFEPANENIMNTPTTNRADYNIRSAQLRQVFERATGADILDDEMDELAKSDPKLFNKIFKFDDDTVNPAKIYHQDVPSARDAAVGATSEQSYNLQEHHITIYPDPSKKDSSFIVVNQDMFEREILGNQKNFEKFKASLGDPPENASPEDYYYGLSQDEQNRILKPTKGLALQNSRSKDNFEVDKKGLQLFLQKYHQHALEQADQILGDDDKSIRLFQYSTPDKEDFRFNRLSLNRRQAPHAIKPVSVTNAMNVYSEIKSPDQLAMRNEKGEISLNLNFLKKYVQDHGYPTSVDQMAFYRKEHNPDFPIHVLGFKKDKDGNEIRSAKGNKVPNSFSSKEGWANYAQWVWGDARQRYGIPTQPTTAERIISVQSAAGEQQTTTATPPKAQEFWSYSPFGPFISQGKSFDDWADQEIDKIESTDLSDKRKDKILEEILNMKEFWIEKGGKINQDSLKDRTDSSLEDRMERAGYDPILLNYINPDYMESLLDGLQKPVRELQKI